MSIGLLFNCDLQVAALVFSTQQLRPMSCDRAVGLIDNKSKTIVGGILFQHYNGCNVEGSYYGQNTLSPSIVRSLAHFVITTFDAGRVTVVVSKRRKRLMRSLTRMGFRLEGTQRCYFGKQDIIRNTGVRFVMYRNRLDQLARLQLDTAA